MSADPEPPLTTESWLEDLVAEALEALDRDGDEGLATFLAAHPRHRDRIAELVAPFRDTGLLRRDARDQLPERLGDFRLRERLGAGGMGVVFLAEQESLGRPVALKVVRPDLVFFAGTRERFRREIEVVARLSHPAIVPIVATGEHDGMPWYAMPRLEGCTIDEATKRLRGREPATLSGADLERVVCGPATASSQMDRSVFAGRYWQACVRLVRQAALGLEHAHRQGIVHRDVKPSNVMLTIDGRAMLLDFGLARVQGDPKLTRTGTEPGSPAYMAPEQVRGLAADERSDVYSLAATLLQLLDLEPPFGAHDAEQLRQQILRGRLGGPRNRAVPRELAVVLAVAMDVDRERRHASALAFADDLAAVLERRPIAVRPLPAHVRALRWLQRHRAASTVLAVAAVLAVVLPAGLAWQRGRSLAEVEQARQRAEIGRDRALQAVSGFLTRFASSELATMPGGLQIGDELLAEAVQIIDSMATSVDAAVLRPHALQARRWYVNRLRRQARSAEALSLARTTLAEWEGLTPPSARTALLLAGLRIELASLAVDGVEVPELEAVVAGVEPLLTTALRLDPAAQGLVDEQRASLAKDLAALATMRGDAEGAVRVLGEAVAMLATSPPVAGRTLTRAVLHNRYGDLLRERGELGTAAEQFEIALALLAPAGDPSLSAPESLHVRGYAWRGLGRIAAQRQEWDRAATCMQSSVELCERHVNAYPDNQESLAGLGGVLTELAQVERFRQTAPADVTAMLERARRLFARCEEQIAANLRTRASAATNLQVLTEQYWQARDPERMADAARELARIAGKDGMALARAAWRLLQASALFDQRDDEEQTEAAEAAALDALLACDAAGWAAGVDLEQMPWARLRGRPGFAELAGRRPADAAARPR
jgi:serine/threonine protein kinase/tetratricopeptide (TPR) repeat protein